MKTSKFFLSTFIAAAAMTSTAFAESTPVTIDSSNSIDTEFGKHATLENAYNTDTTIKFAEDSKLSEAEKYFLYTDADLLFTADSATTVDVSSASRFYLMDTILKNGDSVDSFVAPAPEKLATVTIDKNVTLKGKLINLGQAIDTGTSGDVSDDGNAKRDGGAMNLIVNGKVQATAFYVGSYSTLTISETGSVERVSVDRETVIRAGGKIIVNGNGWTDESAPQFCNNWTSNQGGTIELNNTKFQTGTFKLLSDSRNAILTSEGASLSATGSAVIATEVSVGEGSVIDLTNSSFKASSIANSGTISVTGESSVFSVGVVNNVGGVLSVTNGKLENVTVSGSVNGENNPVVCAEGATLTNVNVSGQETYTVNTNFNGGTFSGKVYTGKLNGEKYTDSEATISGVVDASTVDWQNYGKLTISEGAELKTAYFSEGSRQILTVDGTITADVFRGYNGIVGEKAKIVSDGSVQFYGNASTQQRYDISGLVVVTHNIAKAHNLVIGFNLSKQWFGNGPSDYWNIGGANTMVNVSGENALLQIKSGKYGTGVAIIHVDEEGARATLNLSDKAKFDVEGKVINNGILTATTGASISVTGDVSNGSSGVITVGAGSTLTANVIAGEGDVVLAGTISVVNGLSADVLTIHEGATLNIGSAEGVMLAIDTDALISANEIVLVSEDGVESGTSLSLQTLDIKGTGADELAAALGSEGTTVYVKDSTNGVVYNATFNGTNVTVGAAVPEPSAFGLLAGIGALALVAARRRRK